MSDHEWTVFGEEASTAIRGVEEILLNLEAAPESATASELNLLYRGLHTLKGSSGFLSLKSFGRVAHACEDLVSLSRDHGVPLDAELVDLLLEALDALRGAVAFLVREHQDISAESIEGLLDRITRAFGARGGVAREAVRYDALIFEDDGDVPMFAAPGGGVLIGAPEDEPEFAPGEPTPAASPSVMPAATAPAPSRPRQAPAHEARAMEFLRIDGAKVTALMDLAGELGLACSAVTHHPELAGRDLDGFATAAHKLELLVREIQNDLSALRLVPVTPLFQRMRRVVRDAARTVDKEVDLVIAGEDTEVDKVMLDAIQDPLIHILRNAVDHGLEPAADRVAAGKPPRGRISLSAAQLGGAVSIEVRDDGRGIDRERVLARAIERGLCEPGAELTDAELNEFVFLPGFSTKREVDELSGRGVGMDVVRSTVEALRGRVTLTSRPGLGSRIVMTMPLTLAFVEAMVVREHGRLFALPIEKVFEVSKVDGSRVVTNPTNGQTTLWVRQSCVPVVWLHQFWSEPRTVSRDLHGRLVVLVQTSRGAVALPVDDLIGNQQVMLKPLRGVLSQIRAASGCGMLRTGDVAIALDCDRLHA